MENQEEVNMLVPEIPALTIHDGNNIDVLKIETNGRILWRPQGSTELVELDVEKDLSIAFALCIEMLSGMPSKQLLTDVRGKAIKDNAQTIAEQVAQYLIDIKLTTEEHRDIHIKNVSTIVNGI